MNHEFIQGGYILLSRKLLKNGIMEKPPLYLKLWIWMLMQASFKDHGDLKRGQFFTSLERMREAMAYKIGCCTRRPTKKEIRGVIDFLTKGTTMVTTKVTHGMIITILNYDHYQQMQNYEGHSEGHNAGQGKGTILRKKGIKKEKTPDFFSLKERYSDQDLIDKVFQALASTRKSNKVAESVLLAQLQKWERYPIEQVEAGIKVYLKGDHASEGKREAYLLAIIRNQKPEPQKQKSTGSALLDSYYANSN